MKNSVLSAGIMGLAMLYAILMIPSSVLGMPISDYKEKMSFDERASYFSGGISALSFQYFYEGKRAKSKCVYEWYYKDDNAIKDITVAMVRARLADPSRHIETVMIELIEAKCGHLDQKKGEVPK